MTDHPFSEQAVAVFRTEVEAMKAQLASMRESALKWGAHPDWPWSGFVLSYATLGGSANWEQHIAPSYQANYAWDALVALSAEERCARFAELGNPRYKKRVHGWVAESYDRIVLAGGPAAIRRDYIACDTAEARIAFIRSYPGFGEKYGRNIPMDRYDDLVRNHFALDHRLKTVLADCGHSSVTYRSGEVLLRQLALRLEVDAWALDRVIYSRFYEIRAALARGEVAFSN